jgi:hypothetical protein
LDEEATARLDTGSGEVVLVRDSSDMASVRLVGFSRDDEGDLLDLLKGVNNEDNDVPGLLLLLLLLASDLSRRKA